MGKVHSHYENLKVSRDAPIEVIRAAYKSLSQKYHPDRNVGNDDAARIMALINVAYETLSDPEERQKHDEWIRSEERELNGSTSRTREDARGAGGSAGGAKSAGAEDPLYPQAVDIVLKSRRATISLLQRHLRIDSSRAASMIAAMELDGIVSAQGSDGNRTVLTPFDERMEDSRKQPDEVQPATQPQSAGNNWDMLVGFVALAWMLASFVAGYRLGTKFWVAAGIVAALFFIALKEEPVVNRLGYSLAAGMLAASAFFFLLWLF